MSAAAGSFDAQTLAMLKTVFNEACRALPPYQRTQEMRLHLATCILTRAAKGGLSPAQLLTYALTKAASSAVK
jgi:hypothetical protein